MSISATSSSSIFSSATTPPADKSDLSPAPLDPEDEPAIHRAASCIPQLTPSASIITANTAVSSTPHPSAIPTCTANPKKGNNYSCKEASPCQEGKWILSGFIWTLDQTPS
ncbi:hypothetical protein V8B97DRAFT_2003262 [Scleroderma yunnanense]